MKSIIILFCSLAIIGLSGCSSTTTTSSGLQTNSVDEANLEKLNNLRYVNIGN